MHWTGEGESQLWEVSSIKTWSICMCLHRVAVCRLQISTQCRLGLARNVNSVVWEGGGGYLGITCGLTQPRGILGVWRGLYTEG